MRNKLTEGDALRPWVVERVDPERMRTFARVLDDPNPIHLDSAAAQAAGLGDRVVTQGPLSFGLVLNMLREAVPGSEVRDLDVRLTANVFAGDRVSAGGRVAALSVEGALEHVHCDVWVDVDGGQRALAGTAVCVRPV